MNLPNKLTVIRIFLVPVIVLLLLLGNGTAADHTAAVLFILGTVTDFLDGKIARKRQLVTDFGKFMDPLADKLLVCSAMICLMPDGRVPAWAAVIIVAREFAVSGLRLVAANKGVVLAAGKLGKMKTSVQTAWILFLLLHFSWGWWGIAETVLMCLAVILTVVSFTDYLLKNIDLIKER